MTKLEIKIAELEAKILGLKEDIGGLQKRVHRLECPHKFLEFLEEVMLTRNGIMSVAKCKACGKVVEEFYSIQDMLKAQRSYYIKKASEIEVLED